MKDELEDEISPGTNRNHAVSAKRQVFIPLTFHATGMRHLNIRKGTPRAEHEYMNMQSPKLTLYVCLCPPAPI